jgi:hypothetical protein
MKSSASSRRASAYPPVALVASDPPWLGRSAGSHRRPRLEHQVEQVSFARQAAQPRRPAAIAAIPPLRSRSDISNLGGRPCSRTARVTRRPTGPAEASVTKSRMSAGSPIENMPGAPGSGGGMLPRWTSVIPGTAAQGFRSGVAQTTKATGRPARTASIRAARESHAPRVPARRGRPGGALCDVGSPKAQPPAEPRGRRTNSPRSMLLTATIFFWRKYGKLLHVPSKIGSSLSGYTSK